jgi:FkbM family methyltransferase
MLTKEYGKAKARILSLFTPEPGRNPDPNTNGEYRFLRFAAALPEVGSDKSIVDVGANHGEWTAEALRAFAGTAISRFICVEPVPTFLDRLRERHGNNSRVEIVDFALSDRAEPAREIFEIGGGGRMYKNYRGGDAGDAASGKTVIPHRVRVLTGDEAAQILKLKPYLMKIDCDGHDFHVLRGFGETLRRHRPLVQFEYSDFWIGAGSRLRDACRFLEDAGYSTYKTFPDRLVRFKFNALFETFGYQNIIAAPREFSSFARATIPLPAPGRA